MGHGIRRDGAPRPTVSWTRRAAATLAAGLAWQGLAGTAQPAAAQRAEDWPSRSVRLIVPYPPGGTTDIVARRYAEFLRARIGQPVVVENRAGAATNIGTEAVVRSAPDGHTLLLGTTALASNPTYGPAPGFDPMTALDPVGLITDIPYLVAAHPGFPARNAREMIGLARANPGRHTIASAQLDFQVALLMHRTGVRLEHVGFRGGAPSMTEAIAGRVDMVYALVPVLLPAVRSGALVALGVTGDARSPVLPDVETFREAGRPGAVSGSWYAIFVSAGTPSAVVERLAAETHAFAGDAEVTARLTEVGVEPRRSTPEELRRMLRELTEEYAALTRELGPARPDAR